MSGITSGRDDPLDVSLRPTGFSEFIGQAPARANLEVFIAAAKQRKAALDHVLFVGPPGLGGMLSAVGLGAVATAHALGVPLALIAASLPTVTPAPGRFQALDEDQPFPAVRVGRLVAH